MQDASYVANAISAAGTFVCWCIFGYVFLLGRRPGGGRNVAGAAGSSIGLVLQLAGMALVWVPRLPLFSPIVADQYGVNIVLQAAAVALAAVSIWFAVAARRELGRQWSIEARLIEGHKLVTTGPYAIVRHPIYTAMFGLLIATGLALTSWPFLGAGAMIFLYGTRIRTTAEERLLEDAFGEEFTAWRSRVPGLIPKPKF